MSDARISTFHGGGISGFGLGISPMPKLTVHVRGELQMAVDGGTSRKFGNVTLGASYALFSMP